MSKRLCWLGSGFLLLALLCVGCAPRTTPAPKDRPNPHLTLALDMTPRPVTSLDPTQFTVRIRDAAGEPVQGAAVKIDLDMPSMPMGDNTQMLREARAGEYGGTSRFTMAGAWRVAVTADLGSEHTTQVFPIRVR